MNDTLTEDVVGDLEFSTYVENDLWFDHDNRLDVEFGLDQQEVTPPGPDDSVVVVGSCDFAPNNERVDPDHVDPGNVHVETVPCPEILIPNINLDPLNVSISFFGPTGVRVN